MSLKNSLSEDLKKRAREQAAKVKERLDNEQKQNPSISNDEYEKLRKRFMDEEGMDPDQDILIPLR